jgi:hypothetical protein
LIWPKQLASGAFARPSRCWGVTALRLDEALIQMVVFLEGRRFPYMVIGRFASWIADAPDRRLASFRQFRRHHSPLGTPRPVGIGDKSVDNRCRQGCSCG